MNSRAEPSPIAAAVPLSQGGWHARLELGFARRADRTVLAHRAHRGPLRVQRALYPEGDAVCHVILLHPPAGIAGGDALEVDVTVGEAAHALLTTPGAGKWYRSAGALGQLRQRIRVAAGGICEWLPQENIVFDGALGASSLEVDLSADAVFIGSEILCLGRTASGERFERGQLGVESRLRRDGRALWLERGRLQGGEALLQAASGLGGAPVCATLMVAAPTLDNALRDACRAVPAVVGEGAVTLMPGLLLARYLGPGAEPARQWLSALWALLRPAVAGRAAQTPRIWNT